MPLLVVHGHDLHGVANRVVFELLLQNVVSIWPVLVVLQGLPLLQVEFGSLVEIVVLIEIEIVIESRGEIDQSQFELEL